MYIILYISAFKMLVRRRKSAALYSALTALVDDRNAPCHCTGGIYQIAIYLKGSHLFNGKAKLNYALIKPYPRSVERRGACPSYIF